MMGGIFSGGTTLYFPTIYQNYTPPNPRPRGFGIGIKSQSRIPVDKTLKLLKPDVYHTWGPWGKPGWMNPDNLHGKPAPGFYPASWNPPFDEFNSEKGVWEEADLSSAWMAPMVAENPGAIWLIGNEPVNSEQVGQDFIMPERMARHAQMMKDRHGIDYALFGGIVRRSADWDYARKLRACGVQPTMEHWHLYPSSLKDWDDHIELLLRWTKLPILITECNMWGATDQRPLMDKIMETLHKYEQIHAVFWYVNWEPRAEGWPNMWQLLTEDDPVTTALTETGRQYLNVRGL